MIELREISKRFGAVQANDRISIKVDPATIHASCEDYRAAASIDLVHDESDMDRKISCPVLVLWGANGLVGQKYDVLAIWRDRATQVSGKGLPCGHWLAEEVPDETLAEITRFLAA